MGPGRKICTVQYGTKTTKVVVKGLQEIDSPSIFRQLEIP